MTSEQVTTAEMARLHAKDRLIEPLWAFVRARTLALEVADEQLPEVSNLVAATERGVRRSRFADIVAEEALRTALRRME